VKPAPDPPIAKDDAPRSSTVPLTPVAWQGDTVQHVFRRGASYPRAIAWLGFKSFWGHLFHLAASVIATEDIDARDWMHADKPDDLTLRIGKLLGGEGTGASLTEVLEHDLWIDFLADTGDDADVSGAVAAMLFREYRVTEDGQPLELPRGDILLFGGDTAYPVATEMEIHNRVCVPFNRVLKEHEGGRLRVLLGIPGNHDWYDGLDGFARMFRARRGSIDRASAAPDENVDRSGQLGHFIDWVEAFSVGHYVTKRSALPLLGYTPVQGASYFALRLAPDLDMWAVDRQLRAVDYTQKGYFAAERALGPKRGRVLVLADPPYAMLEPNTLGMNTLADLEMTFAEDAPLVLTGDTHHYCRQVFGDGMQVIAGGGGAMTHPARIWRRGFEPPAAEFPGPRASFALAMQAPWQIANGRAGFLAHGAAALVYLPVLVLTLLGRDVTIACAAAGCVAWMTCAILACGAWVAMLPWGIAELCRWIVGSRLAGDVQAGLVYVLSIYPAVLGFGTFLMVLTLLGLEQNQAFSALAHPGYKHFVRLRVRRDGSAVDGWTIGKVDTLDPESKVVLVDRWTWRNPGASK
jgi:hypothetical protein